MNSDLEVLVDKVSGKKYVHVTIEKPSLSACFSAFKVLSLTSSSRVTLYLHKKGVLTLESLIKKAKSDFLVKNTVKNTGTHSSKPTPPQHLEFEGGYEAFIVPNVEVL